MILGVEASAFSSELDFGADDGFDAGVGGGLREFDCAMEVIFVSQCDSGKVVKFGEFDDGIDGESGIEKGIVAVKVQRDV